MNKEKLIKKITKEMREISKEYDVGSWDYVEVDRMESEEAFNRGYYRALEGVLSELNELK